MTATWAMVFTGFMQLIGISPLAFGLGMYLPMDLNTPLLLGAVLAWAVRRLTAPQAKYIRLFYGEAALRAIRG